MEIMIPIFGGKGFKNHGSRWFSPDEDTEYGSTLSAVWDAKYGLEGDDLYDNCFDDICAALEEDGYDVDGDPASGIWIDDVMIGIDDIIAVMMDMVDTGRTGAWAANQLKKQYRF